jgi:hypothetical protein
VSLENQERQQNLGTSGEITLFALELADVPDSLLGGRSHLADLVIGVQDWFDMLRILLQAGKSCQKPSEPKLACLIASLFPLWLSVLA